MTKLPQNLRAMHTDVYAFCEKYFSMGNTPEEWEEAAKTMNDVAAHHNFHPLAERLLFAVYDWLDAERNGDKR
jgi:hypothetical protein